MSRFYKYMLENDKEYSGLILEDVSLRSKILSIVDNIFTVKKELDSIMKEMDDKKLKNYISVFIGSCVFISRLLKVVCTQK